MTCAIVYSYLVTWDELKPLMQRAKLRIDLEHLFELARTL